MPHLGVSAAQLARAIDVIAALTEHAERSADGRPEILAMARTLGAAFAHLVAYSHATALDGQGARAALSQAATHSGDIAPEQVAVLRIIARRFF